MGNSAFRNCPLIQVKQIPNSLTQNKFRIWTCVCLILCFIICVCVCICMKYVCILIMLLSCLNTSLPSFEQQDFSASLIMINYQANRSIVSKSNQEVIIYIKKI